MSDLIDFIVWLRKKKEKGEILSAQVANIAYYVYKFLEEQEEASEK